jgi:MoaA/NifB/PqqE/SkfB family radical SAM enzyme
MEYCTTWSVHLANLVITEVCNLSCPYCFASDHMAHAKANASRLFISIKDFEEHLDYLDRSGIDQIRLIGGEPTLHPQFPELIQRAMSRNKQIVIFSHGLMPEQALSSLTVIPPDQCTILINMNATRAVNGPTTKEQTQRFSVIKQLEHRVVPGFNIYRPNFQLDFLLSLIDEANCRRSIRLGIAHASLSGNNKYLHPKQYPVVGHQIVLFARRAFEAGVRLEFDCGFVRCMFSDEDMETLREVKADFGWRCNPILDIDLNGQAVHCFPLAERFQMHLTLAEDTTALREKLIFQTAPYRIAGVYRECLTCSFKSRGDCTGGCLASTIRRFQNESLHFTIPATKT